MNDLLEAPPAPPEGFTLEAPPEPPTGFRLEGRTSRYPVAPDVPPPPTLADELAREIHETATSKTYLELQQSDKLYPSRIHPGLVNKAIPQYEGQPMEPLTPDEQMTLYKAYRNYNVANRSARDVAQAGKNIDPSVLRDDQKAKGALGSVASEAVTALRQSPLVQAPMEAYQLGTGQGDWNAVEGQFDIQAQQSQAAHEVHPYAAPVGAGVGFMGRPEVAAATIATGGVAGPMAQGATAAGRVAIGAAAAGTSMGGIQTFDQAMAGQPVTPVKNFLVNAAGGAAGAAGGEIVGGVLSKAFIQANPGKAAAIKFMSGLGTAGGVQAGMGAADGQTSPDQIIGNILAGASQHVALGGAELVGELKSARETLAAAPPNPEVDAAIARIARYETTLGKRDTQQGQQIVQGIENTREEAVDQSLRQAQARAAEQPTPPPGFTLETSTPERAALEQATPPVPAQSQGELHEAQVPVRETQGQVPQAQAPGVDELPATGTADAGKEVLTDQSGGVTDMKPPESGPSGASTKQTASGGAAEVTPAAEGTQAEPKKATQAVGAAHTDSPEFSDTAAEQDTERTGIRRSEVDDLRKQLNLPEMPDSEKRSWAEALAKDPHRTSSTILNELRAKPNTLLNDSDWLKLGQHITDIKARTDAANKAIGEAYAKGDTAAEDAAREAFNAAVKEMDDFTNTIRDNGKGGAKAESGRALAAQAAIFKMDTSLDKMLYDRQVAKGESLTEAEAEDVRKEHNAIQKAREAADIEDAENHGKAAQAAAEFHLEQLKAKAREDDTPAPVKKLANRIKDYLNTTQDAALARIRARGTKVGANDISNLVDETIVGSIEITKGLINVGEWSARMVELLGDSIKPHLTKLFDAAKAHAAKHEEKILRKFAGLESDKVKAEVKAKPVDMLGKIQERQKGGSGLDELAPYIKALALEKVRGGVSELPPLLDALHADLKPLFPDATKEQIRDAMSGYGKVALPDPEAAKVTLRDLNQQAIKMAQLDALKKKEAPLATGPRRDAPSPKVQALTKEVNAKKRELGIVTTDPERQLKSTLDSMKTRVRNRRDLLQTEIDTGQRIVQGVPKKISDAELESLRTELDAVKKAHEDIFGKKGMSDEQKLKLATSAAEANQKMWQERLDKARSGVFDKAGKNAKLSSPEIEALRKQTDAAKAEFKELKDAADPPATWSQNQEKNLLKRVAAVEQKLQTGDTSAAPTRQGPDPEGVARAKKLLADANQKLADLRSAAAPKSQAEQTALKKRIAELDTAITTGNLAAKSGGKQGPPTAEIAGLRAQRDTLTEKLNELRKADPEQQVPALEQRIAKLKEMIASGDIQPKASTESPDNAYTKQLKQERDALNEKLAELRKADPVLKAKAEVDAAERAAEEYDRKLQAGEFTKGQPAPKSSDPAAMAARTRLEQAREAYNKARDADPAYIAGKEKSSDAAYVRSLTRRAADLADREARGDFAPRTPNPKVRGPDAVAAKAAYEAKRQAWELKKMQWELDRRAPWEKGLDNTTKVVRASILSGPITLLKLVNASFEQVAFKPLSELAGTIIRETPGFRDLAKKASLEGGGFDPKAYGASIKSMLTRGLKDAHQTLRDPTHKSELDLLYGKKGLPQSNLEVFGILHGAEKAPLKRFAFEYAKSKIQRAALARGENIADPVMNDRIGREAYADAERAIFQEENRLTDATNRFISGLEAKNKDGTTNTLGKIGATAARVALPVAKVGTNIVAQTFEHVAGLEWGLAKLAWNAKALDKLTPGQANIIMRNLKRGSVGTAAAAIGWFAPAIVASIPKILMHNPLLQAMQWGANAATAANSPNSAKDQEKKGIARGMLHATTETVRETPLFREMGDEAALLNPTQQDASLGRTIGGLVVPQASSQIARLTDSVPRKPKGIWENIEMGIPGLRQRVPEEKKAKTTALVSALRKNPSAPAAQAELHKLTKGEQDDIRERYIQASDEIAAFHNGPHEAALAKLEQMPPEKRNAREVRSGIGMTSYMADLRARLQTEMLKAKTPADSAKLRELLGRLNKLK